MAPKTRTMTATAVFFAFAVLFFLPVPYRNYFVLVTYFLAQWCLFVRSTPYRITSLRPLRF